MAGFPWKNLDIIVRLRTTPHNMLFSPTPKHIDAKCLRLPAVRNFSMSNDLKVGCNPSVQNLVKSRFQPSLQSLRDYDTLNFHIQLSISIEILKHIHKVAFEQ
jgi:hypothetical protein